MTQNVDLNMELARLLAFTAKVSTAIRMCSSYAAPHVPKTAPDDVMWLSESLHSFDRLAEAVQGQSPGGIVSACDSLLESYRYYQAGGVCNSNASADTFQRNRRYFLLDEGISVFLDIKQKALSCV